MHDLVICSNRNQVIGSHRKKMVKLVKNCRQKVKTETATNYATNYASSVSSILLQNVEIILGNSLIKKK